MKLGKLSLAFSLIACLTGCARIKLHAYAARGLSQEPFKAKSSRSLQMGHLLVDGKTEVLEVFRFDPGNPFAIDDEGCDILLVELPSLSDASLPSKIQSPRAFLRRCACTWGNCTEEASVEGRVEVREQDERGVRAAMDLLFPSGRKEYTGWFEFASPDERNLPDRTASE